MAAGQTSRYNFIISINAECCVIIESHNFLLILYSPCMGFITPTDTVRCHGNGYKYTYVNIYVHIHIVRKGVKLYYAMTRMKHE